MATITLTVEDEGMVNSIKNVCKMIKGVTAVKVQKPKVYDVTKTAGYREAMEDIAAGRLYEASSVEDMFSQILGRSYVRS